MNLSRVAGLHSPDGDDLGEATYAVMSKPDEEILVGNGRRLRVLDVVPFEEDESPFVGMLNVEAVYEVATMALPSSGPARAREWSGSRRGHRRGRVESRRAVPESRVASAVAGSYNRSFPGCGRNER